MRKVIKLFFSIVILLLLSLFVTVTFPNGNFSGNVSADDGITPTPTSSSTYVALTSPYGGAVIQEGQSIHITWNSSSDIDHVELAYTYGPGDLSWITISPIPNTGSYDYFFNDGSAISRQAKFIIYGVTNNYVVAQNETNDSFTVLPAPSPTPVPMSVTVTYPNGGEVLQAGQTYRITWNSSNNINNVDITGIVENGGYYDIADAIPNVGYYDWNTGYAFKNNAQVKFEVRGYVKGVGNVADESDNDFTFVYPTPTTAPTQAPTPTNMPTATPTYIPTPTISIPLDKEYKQGNDTTKIDFKEIKKFINKAIDTCIKTVEHENKNILQGFFESKLHNKTK
jgi:hypothetical protein